MSYDDDDYGREQFYDQVREELTGDIVSDFTFDRLRSFYVQHPKAGQKPYGALTEARLLFKESHFTAAFIHAVIVSEVTIKTLLVEPIVTGLVHNAPIAPLIANMVSKRTWGQFTQVREILFQILNEVAGLNLHTYKRVGATKILWDEITEIQTQRNGIMHRGDAVAAPEAELAIAIGAELFENIFRTVTTKLGFHLHSGFELCEKTECSPKYLAMCHKLGIPQ